MKTAYGVAGQGIRRFEACGEERESVFDWAVKQLGDGGKVIVEPWLGRVIDFSAQYEMGPDSECRFLGFTRLHNTRGGQFRACSVERHLASGCPDDVARFVHGGDGALQRFYEETLPAALKTWCGETDFSGPLGVDAFIFRHGPAKRLCLQPIVEVNPRTTMGRVTWELARRLPRGTRVNFEIVTRSQANKAGFGSLAAYAERVVQTWPPRFHSDPRARCRLISGVVPLNDPEQAKGCLALLRVGDPYYLPEEAGSLIDSARTAP